MIGIHKREGSFSDYWIKHCNENNIPYKEINLFSTNIITDVKYENITHLLFHVNTKEYRNNLFLKNLTLLLEQEGISVFPEFSSFWHYDDKLQQKYLFEQKNIPHAKMYAFFSKKDALNWIENDAVYPFVFKLKGGAGSRNVKLVKNKYQGRKLAKKMFGKGMNPLPHFLKDPVPKIIKHNKNKDWVKAILRSPLTLLKSFMNKKKYLPVEKGYFLAQKFYPNNEYDTRVTVVGNKICAFRRKVRPNDFRASGSGLIDCDPDMIDKRMLKIALDASKKIGGSSFAFDFIYDENNTPLILEVSYCYLKRGIIKSGAYWDENFKYYPNPLIPEHEILISLLKT